MTRNPRSRASIEARITDLYIRLMRRQTNRISRKMNLKKRMEFFRGLLEQMDAQSVELEKTVETETQTTEG